MASITITHVNGTAIPANANDEFDPDENWVVANKTGLPVPANFSVQGNFIIGGAPVTVTCIITQPNGNTMSSSLANATTPWTINFAGVAIPTPHALLTAHLLDASNQALCPAYGPVRLKQAAVATLKAAKTKKTSKGKKPPAKKSAGTTKAMKTK